jgi:DNA-3-methyladenine glycosylase
MPDTLRLNRAFFERPTLEVARALLGTRLVRLEKDAQDGLGRRIAGIIVETEAYIGQEDLGCHARAGLTPRTRVMFGLPGHAYVYFTYGLHWMLNFVTEREGFPAAVLIRAVFPTEGIPIIATRRSARPRSAWTDGPAKVCQALDIDFRQNGADLCSLDAVLFVEAALAIPNASVTTGPRVGLNNVPDPWKDIPWRFRVADVTPLLREFCTRK